MDDQAAVRVTLTIDRTGEPMSGWLESPALRTPFVGILDLVSLLERLRATTAEEGSGD